MRLTADIGSDAKLSREQGIFAILSTDGGRIAFVASGSDDKRRIYVRSLDQLRATVLSGSKDAENPFFSPDCQWLGFFANGKLRKIAVQGGAVLTLCNAPGDSTIVFTPDLRSALSKCLLREERRNR